MDPGTDVVPDFRPHLARRPDQLTAVRRLCGQLTGTLSGVDVRSTRARSRPISSPAANTRSTDCLQQLQIGPCRPSVRSQQGLDPKEPVREIRIHELPTRLSRTKTRIDLGALLCCATQARRLVAARRPRGLRWSSRWLRTQPSSAATQGDRHRHRAGLAAAPVHRDYQAGNWQGHQSQRPGVRRRHDRNTRPDRYLTDRPSRTAMTASSLGHAQRQPRRPPLRAVSQLALTPATQPPGQDIYRLLDLR